MAPANDVPLHLDLSTVNEDPSHLYPDLTFSAENAINPIDEGPKVVQRHSLYLGQSPGGISAFSGTTARTSRSAHELLGLHAEDMLDALPDLSSTSDKLLRLLVPTDASYEAIGNLRSDLEVPDSRTSKNLHRLWNSFMIPREFYGNNRYIHTFAVLRALLEGLQMPAIPYGVWRPDPLLQKANLCSLLMPILVSSPNVNGDQAIEELDQIFPTYFLNAFVEPEVLDTHQGCSALLKETFHLALEIRTQYAIILLSRYVSRANFDPNTILSQIFYQATDRLRGWNMEELRAEGFPKAYEDMILHRVNLIRESFLEEHEASRTGELADIESLKKEFPWDNFVTNVVLWSSARLDELALQIRGVDGDGAEAIKLALEQEIKAVIKADLVVDNNSPQVQLDYDPPSELSHAPMKQIDTMRQPRTSANLLKRPGRG